VMPETVVPSRRFRELRERAGLSIDEIARRIGVQSPCIWDIESFEDEITSCYSPIEVQRFCKALGANPAELFQVATTEPAVSAAELVERIHAECERRDVTLEEFENVVGWRLGQCMRPPERLLEDMSLDGLQWLCRELDIDWRRVILSL
ncbi:MAG TPA: helix-turn-helix transcriptional regulator, partial [Verrucomicrobiae bacterium]|nr:helix-turn-helix transcriptional regulator [Verrucomicrobiae bacterium]